MKNLKKKIVALALIIIILFNLSSTSIAGTIKIFKNDNKKEEIVRSETEEKNESTEKIIGEQIEKRKINEKYFKLNNGNTLVAIYPTKVHYEKNGKMVEINNTLEEKNESTYKNKNNIYEVNFAKRNKEDNNILSVKYEGNEINLQLKSATKDIIQGNKSENEEKVKEVQAKIERKVKLQN